MNKIIIASGPVIVENKKVLLNMHGESMFWKFCGGKVEDFGTDLIANARREVMEEMGIEIEILDSTPLITFARIERPEGIVDTILVHFHARRVGEVKPGEDIRDWRWFDLDNLPENLAPNIIPALKHFGYIKEDVGLIY